MKTRKYIPYWISALLVVAATTTSSAFQMIFDDTFDDADWETFSLGTTGGSTNGVGQDLAAGNPGACRRMVHYLPCTTSPCDTNASSSTIGAIYRFLSGAHDPSSAPIHHINMSMDQIVFSRLSPGPGQGVGNGFRLFQGSNTYYTALEVATNLAWATKNAFVLTAANFDNGVGGHPDFSATGEVITFGYLRSNSNTGQGTNVVINHGIDNFLVHIYGTNDSDLAVAKTASADTVLAGSSLTYTVAVTNIGSVASTGVTVTDALPASVTFVSATPSQGTCTNIGGNVICDLGSMATNIGATVTVVVTPTAAGSITNSASVNANETDVLPDDNSGSVVTTVLSGGTDLTVDLTSSSPTCGPDAKNKNTICTVDGTLSFLNGGVPYIAADYTLTKTCKLPPKVGCKMTACLTLTTLDLSALADHDIQFYLSDDAVLDGLDTPLIKKVVPTTALLKAFGKGKAVCPKFKLAKGTDPSGKFLIIKVDDTDLIGETNESNNTAVYGPIP